MSPPWHADANGASAGSAPSAAGSAGRGGRGRRRRLVATDRLVLDAALDLEERLDVAAGVLHLGRGLGREHLPHRLDRRRVRPAFGGPHRHDQPVEDARSARRTRPPSGSAPRRRLRRAGRPRPASPRPTRCPRTASVASWKSAALSQNASEAPPADSPSACAPSSRRPRTPRGPARRRRERRRPGRPAHVRWRAASRGGLLVATGPRACRRRRSHRRSAGVRQAPPAAPLRPTSTSGGPRRREPCRPRCGAGRRRRSTSRPSTPAVARTASRRRRAACPGRPGSAGSPGTAG